MVTFIRKTIYMTIDDGPSVQMLKKLDVLEKYNIPAILFLRGEYMKRYGKETIQAIQRGFWIANHSYNHPYFSKICFEDACDQIMRTEKYIKALYEQAEVERPCKLFRFPFLDKGGINQTRLQQFLKHQKFQRPTFSGILYQYFHHRNLGSDIDVPYTYDGCEYALFSCAYRKKYGLLTSKDLVKRLYRNDPENGFGLCSKSNDIMLLHDFEETHYIFELLIDSLAMQPVNFSFPTICSSDKEDCRF